MVSVTNRDSLCIEAILVLLGAPFKDSSSSLWLRVTTLKLVAKGGFVMEFPMKRLKAMISSRREAAGEEILGKGDAVLDGMSFKEMHSIRVLHVHWGPILSRKERVWFEERVRDFVWDCMKSTQPSHGFGRSNWTSGDCPVGGGANSEFCDRRQWSSRFEILKVPDGVHEGRESASAVSDIREAMIQKVVAGDAYKGAEYLRKIIVDEPGNSLEDGDRRRVNLVSRMSGKQEH
ncbi:hypothetical protein DFH29DRAFT_879714 [Suillus ampliporus]|nr:hypothetical protein DFH29DRAFT_879714 [Suillus ampliporus]